MTNKIILLYNYDNSTITMCTVYQAALFWPIRRCDEQSCARSDGVFEAESLELASLHNGVEQAELGHHEAGGV